MMDDNIKLIIENVPEPVNDTERKMLINLEKVRERSEERQSRIYAMSNGKN